jgi:trimeric autotransporter adhesin
MNKLKFFILLSGLSLLAGCGGKNGLVSSGQSGVFLQSIVFTPSNPSLTLTVPPAQPATQAFIATATPNTGKPFDITQQVTWSTTDGAVASINKNGVATAVGSGRTYVLLTYTDPGSGKVFSLSTILTVVPQLISVTVRPASGQIAAGTSQQFIATGNYNDNSTADITSQVTWNSSQPVAEISHTPGTNGLATGKSQGSTNITASQGGVSSSPASLTVTAATLDSLTLSPSSPTVPFATRQQLSATGHFSDGTTQDVSRDVSWATLQNPSRVARVSATGVVTALGLGAETITAQSPTGPSASTTVNVDESSLSKINVLPVAMVMQHGAQAPEPVLANGTKQQLRAVAILKDGSSLDATGVEGIAWSSNDTSIATVDPATGLTTTQGAGLAKITAALGSKQGSTLFTVLSAPLQSLAVGPNNSLVPQGGAQNVVAMATFLAPDHLTLFQQDVSNAASWSVDANATLSYVNGLQELATGSTAGTANVAAAFATPGGTPLQASSPLNVTTGQLGSISLVPGSAAVPMDGSRQFVATGNFTDGTQENLSLIANWGSSDETVTTVSPFGFMAASGPGQTQVSATFVDPVSGNTITGSGPVVVNPAALARIDICPATVSNPLVNCPPLDPPQPPPTPNFGNQTQFAMLAIGTFTDGTRLDLTDAVHWSSDTPSVATVSDDAGIPGITTGVGRRGVLSGNVIGGTAVIRASSGEISTSAIVQVSPALLQSLTVKPTNGVVPLGQPAQLKVTGAFSDGLSQDLTSTVQWFSLNPDVAIVLPGGLAYTTGKGIANVLPAPSGVVITGGYVFATMVAPNSTFSWPVGTVFQFHNLAVSAGDVSLLNDTPFTVLAEFDPTDPQHLQPCTAGQNCTIQFLPPSPPPADGNYTVTGGIGQASALITATMNVLVTSDVTPVSGSTTLTVQ